MILVDTSVWVDYFRGITSPEAERLEVALHNNEDLCISGLILTETLQGIQADDQYRRVKRLLSALIYLPTGRTSHLLAADIYRDARKKGRTIRNSVECIIVACAIEHHVPLLQRDRDFMTIASVSKLRLLS